MSKLLCKENTSVCIPEIQYGVLTFDTRFFEMGGDICEIIGVTANPHLIDFKWKGEIYNRSADSITNTLNDEKIKKQKNGFNKIK